MKAILEFNLDEPFDKEAHLRCIKSTDLALVIWDLDHLEMPEEMREKFLDILAKYNIVLDELIS